MVTSLLDVVYFTTGLETEEFWLGLLPGPRGDLGYMEPF